MSLKNFRNPLTLYVFIHCLIGNLNRFHNGTSLFQLGSLQDEHSIVKTGGQVLHVDIATDGKTTIKLGFANGIILGCFANSVNVQRRASLASAGATLTVLAAAITRTATSTTFHFDFNIWSFHTRKVERHVELSVLFLDFKAAMKVKEIGELTKKGVVGTVPKGIQAFQAV